MASSLAPALAHPGLISAADAAAREDVRPLSEAPITNLREVVRSMLESLAHLHAWGWVHLDVRCSDLHVDATGAVLLALPPNGPSRCETALLHRRSGACFDRVPEVIGGYHGNRPAAAFAADMWCAGAAVCELLVGKSIFNGDFEKTARILGLPSDSVIDEIIAPRAPALAARVRNLRSMTLRTESVWLEYRDISRIVQTRMRFFADNRERRRGALKLREFDVISIDRSLACDAHLDEALFDLVRQLLSYDPSLRPSARHLLVCHAFFDDFEDLLIYPPNPLLENIIM